MKNIFYLLLLLTLNSYSQELNFDWKSILGTTGDASGLAIESDSAGYIYIGGEFENTLDYNGISLNSTNAKDGFLLKLDSLGDIIWEKHFRCLYDCSINSIAIKKDNFVVAGYFRNKVQFDTILITNNIDTIYSQNMFLCKYDLNGELIWAKNTGGVSYSYRDHSSVDLSITSEDNIIISGRSIDIALFDTTLNICTLDSIWETDQMGSYWRYFHPVEGFLAKYDKNGNKVWIKNIGGNPYRNDLDSKNNIIISGYYRGDQKFDSITIEPLGTETIFLAKYDSSGKVIWVNRSGGSANQNIGTGVEIDIDDNIYQTGEMCGNSIVFNEEIFSGFACTVGFIVKYNKGGDMLWVKQIGLPNTEEGPYVRGNSLVIDSNGDINLTGHFQGVIPINNSSLNSFGAYDLMLLKYDANGNILAGGQYTNYGWSEGNDITIGKDGNYYLTGFTYLDNYDSRSPQYAVIAKVDRSIPVFPISAIDQNQIKDHINIYPNPTHGRFLLSICDDNPENFDVKIFNIVGEKLYDFKMNNKTKDLIIEEIGTYLIHITTDNNSITKKIIVY